MMEPAKFCVQPSPAFRRPRSPVSGSPAYDDAHENRRQVALHGAADTYGKFNHLLNEMQRCSVQFFTVRSSVQLSHSGLFYIPCAPSQPASPLASRRTSSMRRCWVPRRSSYSARRASSSSSFGRGASVGGCEVRCSWCASIGGSSFYAGSRLRLMPRRVQSLCVRK